jgi:hypothetical protein
MGLAQDCPDTAGCPSIDLPSHHRHPRRTAWPHKSVPSHEWPNTGLPASRRRPLTTHRSVDLERVRPATPRRSQRPITSSVSRARLRAVRRARPSRRCRRRACSPRPCRRREGSGRRSSSARADDRAVGASNRGGQRHVVGVAIAAPGPVGEAGPHVLGCSVLGATIPSGIPQS